MIEGLEDFARTLKGRPHPDILREALRWSSRKVVDGGMASAMLKSMGVTEPIEPTYRNLVAKVFLADVIVALTEEVK